MGRPSRYTNAAVEKILTGLCEGHSLREICRNDDSLPAEKTIRVWALDDLHGFAVRYKRAREIGYQTMADELLEIADDGRNDWTTRRNGSGEEITVADHEHISRSRLRFDARRWLLSKALPKIYGDKLAVGGDSDDPLVVKVVKFTDVDA